MSKPTDYEARTADPWVSIRGTRKQTRIIRIHGVPIAREEKEGPVGRPLIRHYPACMYCGERLIDCQCGTEQEEG
jgi:hypothetical protein